MISRAILLKTVNIKMYMSMYQLFLMILYAVDGCNIECIKLFDNIFEKLKN